MYHDLCCFHELSTPTPSVKGWGRQNVETDLDHVGTGAARDATCIGNLMHLDQLGFHVLSTPTPPEEGWGRQNVETKLAKIHGKDPLQAIAQ